VAAAVALIQRTTNLAVPAELAVVVLVVTLRQLVASLETQARTTQAVAVAVVPMV
jgi:hypothetical protein